MNATQVAQALKLSKGRISQLVADGTLDGCYTGEGRRRQFDLKKVAERLGKALDPGQRLGQAPASEAARRAILDEGLQPQRGGRAAADDVELPENDEDRYRLARTLKAEEEARRLRRLNAEEEGRYVLADAAAREARRLMQAELAAVEAMLKEGARAIGDELGVDGRAAMAVLRRVWRRWREERAEGLVKMAEGAELTPEEAEQDI